MQTFKDYFYISERKITDPGYIIKGNTIQDINIHNKNLEKLPDYSRVTVTKTFNCSLNHLTNLIGSPKDVEGTFNCSSNPELKNLIGVSRHISGHFECSFNNLTTLVGAPTSIEGDFDCGYNFLLTSLSGAPKIVNKRFWCNGCNQLTILEGGPELVRENFDCNNCPNIQEDQWQYLPIIGGALKTNKDLSRNELLTLQRLKALGRIGELELTGNLEEIEDDNDPFNL